LVEIDYVQTLYILYSSIMPYGFVKNQILRLENNKQSASP